MSTQSNTLRVLVIGAGTAGLLVAHALKRVNIACTVFEADLYSTARPRDWSFGIYWAQSSLESILEPDLIAQIENCQVDDKAPSADNILPVWDIAEDKLLCPIPAPYSLRLQRRKWLKLIQHGIDIRYGKRLQSIQTNGDIVTATFEDTSEESGNLLIGTEGAHSLTRKFLLPETADLIPSRIVGTCSITTIKREEAIKLIKLNNRHIIGLHRKGYFTWSGIHESVGVKDPGELTFMMLNSWISNEDTGLPRKGPELVRDMKNRAQDYGPLFRGFFEAIPDDAPAWHERLSLWPTQEWDSINGTVTLAGDAAHPMTYHRGQGLNNAIQDAAEFLKRLKSMETQSSIELKKAVKQYERELWPRGKDEVLKSEQNSLMLHNWPQAMESPLLKEGLERTM